MFSVTHERLTADAVLLREFADTFRDKIWPGERLPEVFHDPRSLATEGTLAVRARHRDLGGASMRAALHPFET